MDVRELRERFVHMAEHLDIVQDELNYRLQKPGPNILRRALELIDGLIARAPFHEGDRVALRDTRTIQQWGERNPFHAPGAAGVVEQVGFFAGRFRFGIRMDAEGWVDDETNEVHQYPDSSASLLIVCEDDLQPVGM